MVSAHYLTNGIGVTSAGHPRTIHDFYGFPQPLYEVRYPAAGSPKLAEQFAAVLGGEEDREWGLDHASWAVLRHMYPDADVPVVELSLDLDVPASEHYALGQALFMLPDEGVLVLGSGNAVHNLGVVRWEDDAKPYGWAVEFDAAVEKAFVGRDDAALVEYHSLPGASRSVHTRSLSAAALRCGRCRTCGHGDNHARRNRDGIGVDALRALRVARLPAGQSRRLPRREPLTLPPNTERFFFSVGRPSKGRIRPSR